MSDSGGKPWSTNPNAPKTPYSVYLVEKTSLAGCLVGAVLYGTLIVLFFKCMAALFNPTHRRGESIKWGFVSYTVVMFSLATVVTAMNLHILSISFIDNRNFPGVEGGLPAGPLGYVLSIYNKPLNVIPNVAYYLSNWLADCMLIYRCYLIYSKNLRAIAFPCLMYLGSVAMGIMGLCPWYLGVNHIPWNVIYFSISLSLNVILTLMIVIKLAQHGRNIRAATGSPPGIGGLYRAVATMFIESSALFAVSLLLVTVSWATSSAALTISSPILGETQVIATLLIIQRVASKSALTGNTIAPGSARLFKAGSPGESTGGSDTICKLEVGVETTIEKV